MRLKREREERNNNEDYRREKEAEKEAKNQRKLRVANTRDFDIKTPKTPGTKVPKIPNVPTIGPKQAETIKKLAEAINNRFKTKVPQPGSGTGNGNDEPHHGSGGDTTYVNMAWGPQSPPPPPPEIPLRPPQEWQLQQQQRQQQQPQQQQLPRRIHRVAWNLDSNGNVLQEYVDQDGDGISEVKEAAEKDETGQNGNNAGNDILSVIKDWAERTENEESEGNRASDYMNTTIERAEPSDMAEANGEEAEVASNGDFSVDMSDVMTSGGGYGWDNGPTVPQGVTDTPREYVINRAESELKLTLSLKNLGRTALPNGPAAHTVSTRGEESEKKKKEEEVDPGRTAPLNGAAAHTVSTRGEETEKKKEEEDDPGRTEPLNSSATNDEDTPKEETDVMDNKNDIGRTALSTGAAAHTVSTQWRETEIEEEAEEKKDLKESQNLQEMLNLELQEQNNSNDMFSTDEEDENESGFESQDVVNNINEEAAAATGDAEVNVVITKEDRPLGDDLENPNSPVNGIITPEKIDLAGKEMTEDYQRSTRSRSRTKLEKIIEEDDV